MSAQTAEFRSKLTATASATHPLQTSVQFILTDFQPNKNKQAIPQSEASNITSTAIGMPIKIHFDGIGPTGHKKAIPVGPITRVWQEDEKILAEACIWKHEFPDIDSYLKSASAEQEKIGTSWELFYDNSDKDTNGVEWLKGIVFKGSSIVKDPAYGDRTRMLSVAELSSEELGTFMSDFSSLMYVLDEMWREVYKEQRMVENLTTAENMLDRAKELLREWKVKKVAMAEENITVETLTAQVKELTEKLDQLRNEHAALAEYKNTREAGDLYLARSNELADLFNTDDITARKGLITSMSDTAWQSYLADLKAVASRKASVAETTKVKIPDLTGSNKVSIDALAAALNTHFERGK